MVRYLHLRIPLLVYCYCIYTLPKQGGKTSQISVIATIATILSLEMDLPVDLNWHNCRLIVWISPRLTNRRRKIFRPPRGGGGFI